VVKFFSLHFLEVSINFKQFWKLKAFSGLLSQLNEIRKQNGKEKTGHGGLLGRLAGRPGPHFGPGGNQAGASSACALAWWCSDVVPAASGVTPAMGSHACSSARLSQRRGNRGWKGGILIGGTGLGVTGAAETWVSLSAVGSERRLQA
jgi:hypothetical protein